MTSSNDSTRPPSADEVVTFHPHGLTIAMVDKQQYAALDAWATERIAAEAERADRAEARVERLTEALEQWPDVAQDLLHGRAVGYLYELIATTEGALRH